MTETEDEPPPPVGVYWIKEEDYSLAMSIFDDSDNLPRTWQEWLKMATEMEHGLKASGHPVMRVFIDPEKFREWCAANGATPGRDGRKRFVAAAVADRYGEPS